MALVDFITKQIQEKGWLALSNLYFDNSLTMNVFNTRGFIAYSPSQEMFFCLNCLDSTDSAQVEYTYALMDSKNYIGMQQNLTAAGQEHLQHFDMALYSHFRFYDDLASDEKFPTPTIPTKDAIMAMTADDSGLYPDTDTVTQMDYTKESAIGMYPRDFKYYSGAWVRNWQCFYKNQEKFKTFLSEFLGITDAI